MRTRADSALDEYLVAAARAGDRKAFGSLVLRWNRKLIAHAWRLTGDPEMARDAAQEAWVEIVRGLDRLADERAFSAWAYRIVTRRCSKLIGKAVKHRQVEDAVSEQPFSQTGDAPSPLEVSRIRAAIALLSPSQRGAIALFYLEDMRVAEVAVALDVPAGTVKSRLMHARHKLREVLEEGEYNA